MIELLQFSELLRGTTWFSASLRVRSPNTTSIPGPQMTTCLRNPFAPSFKPTTVPIPSGFGAPGTHPSHGSDQAG
jgi:hypothetical protein